MEETQEKFPAQWALDLLEPTAFDRSNHIFKYHFIPFSMIMSIGGVLYSNMLAKRPLTANKPYILLAIIGGGIFGYGVHWATDVKYAKKDELVRDYIMRHPERFPEPEVKKYKDIFREWEPRR